MRVDACVHVGGEEGEGAAVGGGGGVEGAQPFRHTITLTHEYMLLYIYYT